MPPRKRIDPGKRRVVPSQKPAHVPIPKQPVSEGVLFSFKLLDLTHRKFKISEEDAGWFEQLFQRLKDVSSQTADEIRANKTQSLRAHSIEWSDTSEPDGFSQLPQQLRDYQGYQFQLSKNRGRVHGLFIDDKFYIVWLDPRHNLYD